MSRQNSSHVLTDDLLVNGKLITSFFQLDLYEYEERTTDLKATYFYI